MARRLYIKNNVHKNIKNNVKIKAWLIISLFYEKTNRLTEMKHAQIMAETLYINTNNTVNNNCIEDLVFSENILPKTLFFDTACLLLKLELYDVRNKIIFGYYIL